MGLALPSLTVGLLVSAAAGPQTIPAPAPTSGNAATASPNGSEQAAPTREAFAVGASVRVRTEIKEDFKFGSTAPGNDEQYLLTQLRVNGRWMPADRIAVFIELQDARIFGEEGIDDDATPNIFADYLDLHQGYLAVDLSWDGLPVSLTAGRQKLTLGAQRLVSPPGVGQHGPRLGRPPSRRRPRRRAGAQRLRLASCSGRPW